MHVHQHLAAILVRITGLAAVVAFHVSPVLMSSCFAKEALQPGSLSDVGKLQPRNGTFSLPNPVFTSESDVPSSTSALPRFDMDGAYRTTGVGGLSLPNPSPGEIDVKTMPKVLGTSTPIQRADFLDDPSTFRFNAVPAGTSRPALSESGTPSSYFLPADESFAPSTSNWIAPSNGVTPKFGGTIDSNTLLRLPDALPAGEASQNTSPSQ
jgi:hypothetical protein